MRRLPSLVLLVAAACATPPTPQPQPASEPAAATETNEKPVDARALTIPVLGTELGLPARPQLRSSAAPLLYDDQTWSVRGLRAALDELLVEGEAGRVVLVTAYVQDIYRPPVCPEDQLCPPGKMPHAWIVDDPAIFGKRDAMIVTGTKYMLPEWDTDMIELFADAPRVELEEGQRRVFMGRFRRFSDSGFAHDKGLLELIAVSEAPLAGDPTWIVPVASPNHPRVLALQGAPPLDPELASVPASIPAAMANDTPPPLVEPTSRDDARARAQAANDAGDPLLADYYLRWLLVDDPSQLAAWIDLAQTYADYGANRPALDVMRVALEREPHDIELHVARGAMLVGMDEHSGAIESFRRALAIDPERVDALFGLGMAYAEKAERKLAIETLERFLELAGDETPGHIQHAAQDTIMRMQGPI